MLDFGLRCCWGNLFLKDANECTGWVWEFSLPAPGFNKWNVERVRVVGGLGPRMRGDDEIWV